MPIENEQVQAVSSQVRSGERQKALELMAECKKFHITFMTKQAFRNHYVTVMAKDQDLARQAAFAHFGDQFFTDYPDDEAWQEQIEAHGMKRLFTIWALDWTSSIQYLLVEER